MSRPFRTAVLAAGCLLLAVSAASAIEIRQESGIKPLRPEGGFTGSLRPNYSEQGVQPYRNGEPARQQRAPRVKSRSTTPSINHIQWCQNRYRSYSINDNTYQPSAGIRRSCSSPFNP
ncbi:BA14K family protein [Phyllobacterium salinisoli]|uniref:BA14K family protein n=1 Tax=Phyllobacterium salinisoli TaxID=1899321 RepID=UPI001FDF6B85|nr:BA14K family protein [Phyllobacterium salinisoli]